MSNTLDQIAAAMFGADEQAAIIMPAILQPPPQLHVEEESPPLPPLPRNPDEDEEDIFDPFGAPDPRGVIFTARGQQTPPREVPHEGARALSPWLEWLRDYAAERHMAFEDIRYMPLDIPADPRAGREQELREFFTVIGEHCPNLEVILLGHGEDIPDAAVELTGLHHIGGGGNARVYRRHEMTPLERELLLYVWRLQHRPRTSHLAPQERVLFDEVPPPPPPSPDLETTLPSDAELIIEANGVPALDLFDFHPEVEFWREKGAQVMRYLPYFTHLRRLVLNHIPLGQLPLEVCRLRDLVFLYCDDMGLLGFPNEIAQLTHLQILHASHNVIRFLPSSIGSLQNLWILALDHNLLTVHGLPDTLGGMGELRSLFLADNQFVLMPYNLPGGLRMLDLRNNPFAEYAMVGIPRWLLLVDGRLCLDERQQKLLKEYKKSVGLQTTVPQGGESLLPRRVPPPSELHREQSCGHLSDLLSGEDPTDPPDL